MRRMARLHVEGWAPEYGAPFEPDEQLAPTEGTVDTGVETSEWGPIDGADDGTERIAFVDGSRRVDARLTIDDPGTGPVPGICGTFGVGATLWDRPARRSHIDRVSIHRMAILSGGRQELFPAIDLDPPYLTEPVADTDPDHLLKHLHTRMRTAEGGAAAALADEGWFVIADGPLNDLHPRSTVGHIKSHRVTYLDPERSTVIGGLRAGQRTPLFTLGAYQRYSWYLRLAHDPRGHSWSGVVRCEASGALPLERVRTMADLTAALLPRAASEPHIDPRAPQNLVPVGALERELRRRMGDRGLVFRAIRSAAIRAQEAA
jgi:hypothetical protein